MPRRIGRLACAVTFMVFARPARADTSRVHLDYSATAGCPTRDEFARHVRGRTQLAQVVEQGDADIRLDITLAADASRSHGRLIIHYSDGSSDTRELLAASCGDVADALALVAALAIDPDASTEVRPDTAPTPKSPPSPEVKTAEPVPSTASARSESTAWKTALGADVEVLGAIAPHTSYAISPFVETRLSDDGATMLSLRGAIAYAASTPVRDPQGTARFDWAAARLEGCGPALRTSARIGVRGCVAGEVGALRARGVETPHASAGMWPWVDAEAGARLAWRTSERVTLDLGAFAFAPILRREFFFAPATTIHTVPRLSAAGMVGVGFDL